ncbi:MAG TPA: DUF3352 domain-containing protein [Nocardioidaceae bacterium]|nr:DUF3352 domain-containing protein [Nocardioidaceae bacterium]
MSNDEIVGGGGHPEPTAAPKKRRTGLVVGVVGGVVAAVGLPLGGFAVYNALSGGGTQPHDALPADAIGYLRLDLDPSAGQKIEALRMLDKFPGFEDVTGIDDPRTDLRKALFEAMREDSGCDLDFEDDVEPWLGERLGVAVFAPTDGTGEPGVTVAVQVQDEETARSGIEDLMACGSPDGEATEGWAYYNDYMIVAETQKLADGYAESASRSSLADNDVFAADMDRLGEQGVASIWFDGQGIMDAAGPMLSGFAAPGSGSGGMSDQLEKAVQQSYRSGAVAFRFDNGAAEVATVVTGDAYEKLDGAGTASAELPESTAVAIGVADGDRWVDEQWDSLLEIASDGQDPQAAIDEIEAATGLRLPADLQTLLGSDFALALDGAGLVETVTAGDVSMLRLGARIATDADEFAKVFDDVQTLATRSGVPVRLTKVETDDGVAVATSDEYAEALADGGALGDTAKFQAAVNDAADAQSYAYVDVDGLEPLLEALADPGDQEALVNIKPVDAVGASSQIHDGYVEATLRVTVD